MRRRLTHFSWLLLRHSTTCNTNNTAHNDNTATQRDRARYAFHAKAVSRKGDVRCAAVCVVSALQRARRVPCCTTVVDLYAVQQRYIARCMPGVHRMVSHECAYDESQDSRNNELATTFHGPRPENTTLPATVPVTLTPVSAPSPARGRKRSRRPPGCASGPAAGCFKHPGRPPGFNHPGQPPALSIRTNRRALKRVTQG